MKFPVADWYTLPHTLPEFPKICEKLHTLANLIRWYVLAALQGRLHVLEKNMIL